jgi:hypothetical protein
MMGNSNKIPVNNISGNKMDTALLQNVMQGAAIEVVVIGPSRLDWDVAPALNRNNRLLFLSGKVWREHFSGHGISKLVVFRERRERHPGTCAETKKLTSVLFEKRKATLIHCLHQR